MIKMSKRATVYIDTNLHKILKLKSAETSRSISDLINEAILHEFTQDQQDLEIFTKRAKEKTISYEQLLKELRADGKI